MTNVNDKPKKQFIARAMYHHREKTDRHVVLIVYSDGASTFELFDTRDADGDYLAGDRRYVLEAWRKMNQEVIEAGFQRDQLSGDNDFQQFI
jgi:hypothetical protein